MDGYTIFWLLIQLAETVQKHTFTIELGAQKKNKFSPEDAWLPSLENGLEIGNTALTLHAAEYNEYGQKSWQY